MLDLVIANGNGIAFRETEFVVKRMPFREGFKLLERFRTYIPTLKDILIPVIGRAQGDELSQDETVAFFLDCFGALDEGVVRDAQNAMFKHMTFRASPTGEFVPFNELIEDVAFEKMSMTEVYILMARCIYVNYKTDIEYWVEVFKRNMDAQAELDAAEESDLAPEAEK